MPQLVRMTVAERERYVRWWVEESGLTPGQLRQVAASVWSEREPGLGVARRGVHQRRPQQWPQR